jgi:glycosyltransferase involved in cell wall biosynthesis
VPQRLALNSADLIATVSETSKSDFEQAHLTHRPIIVIPNAPQKLSQLLTAPVQHDAITNLIYMGSFMPYKNVETLIQGMELLPNHTLHLLSRISPARKDELSMLMPKNSRIIFHEGVTDEVYAKLLANNAILVSASLDEGYGLPLAEALELAVPAVVSDLPIFHEVAAEGALYFNPKDAHAFAERVLELSILKNYEKQAKSGKAHIAAYSWDTSAEKLIKAANSLLTPSVTIE